jgi:hypothetical protein
LDSLRGKADLHRRAMVVLFQKRFQDMLDARGVLTLSILLLTFIGGCGGGVADPKLVPVQGKVTLDGQPLPNAIVSFIPDKGPPSGAITDAEGKYEMRFKSGAHGAVVGTHSVTISTDMNGTSAPGAEKVHIRYNKETNLMAEVKPGPNTHDFDVMSQ